MLLKEYFAEFKPLCLLSALYLNNLEQETALMYKPAPSTEKYSIYLVS